MVLTWFAKPEPSARVLMPEIRLDGAPIDSGFEGETGWPPGIAAFRLWRYSAFQSVPNILLS